MYPTLCKVSYYDEDARTLKCENILIYADTFTEAAEKMENYFGKEIDSLSISMYEEGGLWRVDSDLVDALVEGIL